MPPTPLARARRSEGRRRRAGLASLALVALCLPVMADPVAPRPEVKEGAGARFDFALWDRLLKAYVDGDGRVDYDRLRAGAEDHRAVEILYAQIAAQKLEGLPPAAKKAFLLDAYNVIVWKNVLDNRPRRVDEGGFSFFRREYVVAGRAIDLDGLEKAWIRPELNDARIHMALNCASVGCPHLRREAFTPERVEAQLDAEAKKFVGERRNVSVDPASGKVRLSRIFDWYAGDFHARPLAWINRHRAPDAQLPERATVEFVDYDWRLNDVAPPR